MKSPFKFLDPYTLEDKNAFFGREKEIEALYDSVNKNRLVLVYGQSGTGKTSLVKCGLAGRFDITDWYPIFISRQDDINASLTQALQKASGVGYRDDLGETLQRLNARFLRPVYLIFDQFEELLIIGKPAEKEAFIATLQYLMAAPDLACHLLFIVREEYLAWLYPFEKAIPTFFDRRLRVEPMSNAKVKEVLSASFDRFDINLEAPTDQRLDQIIDNISGERSGIQLPYLQVYLDLLWQEVFEETGSPATGTGFPDLTFTEKKIKDFGKIEAVLEKFLQQQSEALQEALTARHPDWPEGGIQRVLDLFVTEEGTKQPLRFAREGTAQSITLDAATLKKLSGLSPAALDYCIQQLEHRRLVRITDEHLELAHDSLAALIDGRRTAEQRRLNEVKNYIAAAYRGWERTDRQDFLTRRQLLSMEAELPKIQLEEHLRDFVAASYTHNDALEAAAEQRRQAELEKERLLRSEAEKAQQLAEENSVKAAKNADRARKRTRVAVAISLLAMVLAIFAINFYKRAEKALEEALTSLLREAAGHINNLSYDAALKALESAAGLGVQSKKVGSALFEIAYFEIETHHFQKGKRLFDKVAQLYGSNHLQKRIGAKDSLALLRKALLALDPSRVTELEKRYYPIMIPIQGGPFMMGCDPTLDTICAGRSDTLHRVTLSSYELAATETTLWQFNLYCEAEGLDIKTFYDASWGVEGLKPVTNTSWYDAVDYANWVSRQKGKREAIKKTDSEEEYRVQVNDGGYRLPTEAEWEYAARERGRRVRFGNGKDIADPREINFAPNPDYAYSSLEGKFRSRTTLVASFPPNALGLYDMSGNLWEWCWDWYETYTLTDQIDPKGPETGQYRVLRGGSWVSSARDARVSRRYISYPGYRGHYFGFRLARAE